MDVLMEVGVGRGFDRGRVGPGDRLRILRGPRGEQDVRRVRRIARHGVEPFVPAEEVVPGDILRSCGPDRGCRIRSEDDRPRSVTFDDLRVDPLLFPVAEVRLDGEDHFGPRDADAFLEVGRGRCVRDADDAAAREHDPQVDRNRFRRHRQVQRDPVSRSRSRRFEAVCDPGRQAMQVAVAHPANLLIPFGPMDDRCLLRIRAETALRDVEARTGEPIWMCDVGLRIEDARRAFLEDDAEAFDHHGPEVLTVFGGPSP